MESGMENPPLRLHLCTLLSESKRILNAHSRHFLALSVLFLLPLSFSLVVYPTLLDLLTDPPPTNPKVLLRFFPFDYHHDHHDHHPDGHFDYHHHHHHRHPDEPISSDPHILSLLYALFVFAFSLLAVGSISFSVFHGFYGRSVKIVSAIKSVFKSFLPLLVTVIISEVIVSLICFAFGLVLFLGIRAMKLLGLEVDYSSPYFVAFGGVLLLALILMLVYLQVNWTLVSVIVVAESSWGFRPLRRSARLIKGMRGLALSMLLFFGGFAGIVVWAGAVSAMGSDGSSEGWKSWAFVVQIVVTSTLLMILLLFYAAATTVLYLYCKALHGELAEEVAEEFARDYVCFPFDNGKVPHIVSVVLN